MRATYSVRCYARRRLGESPIHDEIIREAAKFPLEFQPGENWAYSNIGYQLLGAVITRATDMPWPESLNRRIFEPLGMMNTERLTASAKASHRAIGYSPADNGELKRGLYDPSGTAAGSFLSTIGDLAKLDAALYVDSVLTQKTRAQIRVHRPRVARLALKMVRRFQRRCIEPRPIAAAGDRRISEPITDGAVVILYYSAAMQQNDHRTFLPAPRAAVEPTINDVVLRGIQWR